ncbi:MAG: M23 family metallopeptidase [Candidatus Krumholzibacteriia bacterium]
MKFKRSYTFLYMPDDHGESRLLRVPRTLVLAAAGLVLVLGLGTVLYGVGVGTGSGWLPGGSGLIRENRLLREALANLEERASRLRQELDGVRAVQVEVAGAVNLPLADDETYAAGVGGRGPLAAASLAEVPGLAGASAAGLGAELDRMLRQARIQKQGYLAMLDTLDARAVVRRHIPSIRPVDTGWLSSRFGFRNDPFTGQQTFHRGLDFSTPVGTPVRVTGDGTVASVQTQRGFGKVVKIDHGNGVTTVYAHLDRILVKKGQRVGRGEVIAHSGSSGRSSAPHLHYEIRLAGRPVNPISYILDAYASRD